MTTKWEGAAGSAVGIVALVLTLNGPAVAQDACPTTADLGRGIRASFANGASMTYHLGDQPGVIAIVGMSVDGFRFETTLAQGLYELSTSSDLCDRDCSSSYDYGQEPRSMPVPQPSQRLRADFTLEYFGEVTQYKEIYSTGPLIVVTLGSCEFRAFEVDVTGDAQTRSTSRSLYLVDLGFAVPTEAPSSVGPAGVGTPVRIEAVR